MEPRERVERALREMGATIQVVEFDTPTPTAHEAARVIGCAPGAVVKTLLFMADGRPTVVLVPGDRVARPGALARLLGIPRKRLKMATGDEVLEHTGYPVGAVAPAGMPAAHDVVADTTLDRFDALWASAGTERAMFRVDREALLAGIRAQRADVTAEEPAHGSTAGQHA